MPETEIDDDLDLDDEEEDTPLITKLRARNRALAKDAKKARDLEAEIAKRDREKVIAEAGLQLKPAQITGLLAAHGDKQLTPDLIHETAVELGWAEPKQDVPAEDLEAGDRIAAAAASGGTGASASGVITAAQAAQWPIDQMLRFKDKHPEQFEALKRGETVRGITDFTP